MDSTPILEIRNLKKVFDHDLLKKKQVAIDNLNCHFPTGQCTGFMGHNGAGKTTTIKAIFGLLKPDSGDVLFKGRPLNLEDKRSIGYMPETNKLPANLNCQEILMHHLKIFKPKGTAKRDYRHMVEEKLKEVELWDHRTKRVSKLSKGMGRRLSWAQATIHNPELVILDEPFSGLDPLGRMMMSKLINYLRDDKKTIILCTHELWTVNEVCDELHILKKGRLAYSSLNPIQGQVPKPLMNYQIVTSGISPSKLKDLQGQSLPEWDYINEQDYLIKLGFGEYSDAILWLKALLEESVVVMDFSKHKGFEEEELLVHFEGEKSA
ncbi:ABC transporter ATP-binding protein [Pseudobacteriovorax antillogorgiicola]|uniref:ABC-type multidrug transport system, ATPase component n=1 Tax=Pseudobacteriovorax antillogorgiicola TaxID=1513793 RepID=A0A1Y6CR32_9BACT|nr:ABC transporter ATP-binding protein [Pseudobacteriovorax antillogorgiicola]TCS42244.1 ABC-type multidrug transport system ATPase subunit [Pseudobacteriovorax antillogorgiicola]SMF82574.1 ABC-type multidrug transport system, ATPase component [Pseudobacteriovorax antillogorgiicola]